MAEQEQNKNPTPKLDLKDLKCFGSRASGTEEDQQLWTAKLPGGATLWGPMESATVGASGQAVCAVGGLVDPFKSILDRLGSVAGFQAAFKGVDTSDKALAEAFSAVDKDGSGSITVDECDSLPSNDCAREPA